MTAGSSACAATADAGRMLSRILLVGAMLGAGPRDAGAQIVPSLTAGPSGPAGSTAATQASDDAEPEASPDSPRASVREFLRLARHDRWQEASRFVLASGATAERRAELARKLDAVLQHRVDLSPSKLSPRSAGDDDDGLPEGVDEIGVVRIAGDEDPVRIVRVHDEVGWRWAFSSATTARVDGWYHALPDRAFVERLPPWLLRHGPFGLDLWQWIALPLALLVLWLAGRLLSRATCALLTRVASRTRSAWDDRALRHVHGPLTLVFLLIGARVALHWLDLPLRADHVARNLVLTAATAALFWVAWRSVDVLVHGASRLPAAGGNASLLNMLRVGGNIVKGVVAAIGVLAVLSRLGLPIGTLLAGVGLGSLAVAFGAQKTVENLFGSIALAIDQPFRVGDFVKVDDFTGTVENIGLRSTRFRTNERTTITIPNGMVANMRLETFATRDRILLSTTIGLSPDAPRAAIERVVAGWERVLREHPKTWPDGVTVRLGAVGDSSLDVDVFAWIDTGNWNEFQGHRQDVLLAFVEVARREGVALAHPMRVIRMPAASAGS